MTDQTAQFEWLHRRTALLRGHMLALGAIVLSLVEAIPENERPKFRTGLEQGFSAMEALQLADDDPHGESVREGFAHIRDTVDEIWPLPLGKTTTPKMFREADQ